MCLATLRDTLLTLPQTLWLHAKSSKQATNKQYKTQLGALTLKRTIIPRLKAPLPTENAPDHIRSTVLVNSKPHFTSHFLWKTTQFHTTARQTPDKMTFIWMDSSILDHLNIQHTCHKNTTAENVNNSAFMGRASVFQHKSYGSYSRARHTHVSTRYRF